MQSFISVYRGQYGLMADALPSNQRDIEPSSIKYEDRKNYTIKSSQKQNIRHLRISGNSTPLIVWVRLSISNCCFVPKLPFRAINVAKYDIYIISLGFDKNR